MPAAKKRPAATRNPEMPAQRPAAGGRSGKHMAVFVFSAILIGFLAFSASALIVLLVGMVPTAVAILIDRDPQKYLSITVAALNFAGVSPYLADFLFGTASFSHALALISDVFVLVVMYGAAAAGWALIMVLPPVSAILLGVVADVRIQALRKEQRQLVEEWGDGVTGR